MSFTRDQQPEFRKLVSLAWKAHCLAEGISERLTANDVLCPKCSIMAGYQCQDLSKANWWDNFECKTHSARTRKASEESKARQRIWYEQELKEATGHDSTKRCNAGRDYDHAMERFEVISGDGIKWQMKIYSGDANRILFLLDEVCTDHGIDGDYLRGVAKRMLKANYRPELHLLSVDQLLIILGEVKRFVRRRTAK